MAAFRPVDERGCAALCYDEPSLLPSRRLRGTNARSRLDERHHSKLTLPPRVRSSRFSRCQIKASLRFGLASLLVYATVAFGERWMYRHLGLPGAYGVWTLLFVVFGGLALKPLVVLPKAKRTFWLWFALAFFAYASCLDGVLLHAAWFCRRMVGLACSARQLWVWCWPSSSVHRAATPGSHVELFVAHSAGYFLGEWLHHSLHGKIGMLLWGVCYGLGFGLGLARALYWAQTADTPSSPQPAG